MGHKYYYEFIYQYMAFNGQTLVNFLNSVSKTFFPKQMFGEEAEFSENSIIEIKTLEFKFKALSIIGEDGTHFNASSFIQNRLQPRQFFTLIRFIEKSNKLISEELDYFFNIPGFKIGCLCNDKYNYIQSTDNPSNYLTHGQKHSHLPKYFNELIQDERIDISKNPGRERFLPGMKFIPGYKIWYGKEPQELFGREKILQFKNAIEIKELENSAIEMQLMDDITKCDSRKNQKRQRDIVKYLGVDKLEVSKY